jgi:quinoprotein dehydrogenase-associated probable ABC transporter substrate-binding protein
VRLLLLIAAGFVLASSLGVVSCDFVNRRSEAGKRPTTKSHETAPTATEVVDSSGAPPDALRVCSDPNNLPFSNKKLEGFENKIAALIGREMKLKVEHTWWAQRRGFVRNTLKAGLCDLIVGMPSSSELALTTAPYYRSTYVFVSRRDRALQINSFDDAALQTLKIGVQMIGDDFTNSPPAHALTNRHIVNNVKGYSVLGDYAQPNPPARIMEAVAKGEIDVAVVWGPLAGYFAGKQSTPLALVPVHPQIDLPYLPFVYDISMGVRRGEDAFKARVEEILQRQRMEIDRILDDYGVPRVGEASSRVSVHPPCSPCLRGLFSVCALSF